MEDPKVLPTDAGPGVLEFNGKSYPVYYTHEEFGYSDLAVQFKIDQWNIDVKDGLVMSVARGMGTYGYSQGLFEIAFLDTKNDQFSKIFESEWLDVVLGYLTESEVLEWLAKADEGAR